MQKTGMVLGAYNSRNHIFHGSHQRRRSRSTTPTTASTITTTTTTTTVTSKPSVCLLLLSVMLLTACQFQGVSGMSKFKNRYALFPISSYLDYFERGDPVKGDTEEEAVVQKRQPAFADWEFSDNLGMADDKSHYGDINDAVLASQKTSLTQQEIQRYLAQMKAYYLKNGMPR
ncbi:unnamed protein product [Mesocestoides corti]|nr:unnamed protein product [Mesocestoides corti]